MITPNLLAALQGFGILEIPLMLFSMGLFAFWIWMIVDCATKEDEGSKIAWLLVIILIGAIGAPLYFFVRKLPRGNKTGV